MDDKQDLVIGVVGAGAMGRGIAQVAATGGMTVLLADNRAQALAEAVAFVEKTLSRLVEKGTMEEGQLRSAMARIKPTESLCDLSPCDVLIEAVVENLDVKQALLAQLEDIVSDRCIIASNTSSLSITTIASKCKRPQRVAGLHFFNPVPLMKLVEVIDGLKTDPAVGDTLMEIGRRMGREPVRIRDAPGFLVNQVGRAYTLEAAHLVSEGIASFADVDAVMRDVAGFRMGPFELLDLVGLDVNHPATEMIYRQFYHEPRYRPSVMMQSRLDAGVLGRKTKQGFYSYGQDAASTAMKEADPLPPSCPVWVSQTRPDFAVSLAEKLQNAGVNVQAGPTPSSDALCLVTPVGDDATRCAVDERLDAKRVVAVDMLFDTSKRWTAMSTPLTEKSYIDAARWFLGKTGAPVTIIRDSPGFIAQRIVAMIVNIGASIAQLRTASAKDIDKAVKLGLGYPHGPLAFGDVLGGGIVHEILTNMQRRYGDPRYRSNLWLTRRAELGVPVVLQD